MDLVCNKIHDSIKYVHQLTSGKTATEFSTLLIVDSLGLLDTNSMGRLSPFSKNKSRITVIYLR